MGIVTIWSFVRAAAANIPWTKVAQSTPLIADMLGSAKAKLQRYETSQKNIDEHLKQLQDENARLATALQQMSDKLQALTSRVFLLTTLTCLCLVCAVLGLVLWMLK